MRKVLLLGLGILTALLFILPARYLYVCEIMNNCESVERNNVRPSTLSLMDGDSARLQGYDHFAFDVGSISPNLTDNNEAFLDKLAAYLKANPEKNLTITGLIRQSEQGKSFGMYENLGVARANIIRDFLVQRGIDVNRISLDHDVVAGEDLSEPLKFSVFEPRPDEYSEDGDLVKTQFRFDNMTFSDANFEFNSDVFKPGAAFNIWADSVLTYFELNPSQSLTIVGHTDNIGTIPYNQDLGLRRAQSAKAFFEKEGLEVTIKTATRGEKSPVASNMYAPGRQKNRRVNFIIK
ncbi:MAG: OmpA family protein [Bacteroidota bacterium]